MNKYLARLLTDDFALAVAFVPTINGRIREIAKRKEVIDVQDARRNGVISDDEVNDFVMSLTALFVMNEHFDRSEALEGLAVALAVEENKFAAWYLNSLVAVRRVELRGPVQIAKECLRRRCEGISIT